MPRRIKQVAVGATAALVLAGGGQALAANGGHGKQHGLKVAAIKAAAAYLGESRKQLRQDLHGTSLAQLATQKGLSVQGLEDAMLAAVKARLDKRVAKGGKLTAEREQKLLARWAKRIDRIVNKVRQ